MKRRRMRRTVRLSAELIGDSAGVVAVRTKAEQLLGRHTTTRRLPSVLLRGETGTGKGLLARALHDAGPRGAGAFVVVNCAAIPETLLEAELFGFEQGAFTDARHAKAGLFQTAHRGTLFLDEIGLLPETLQTKLLTVVEDRMVRRLGSTRAEPVDVSIISATSEDLKPGSTRRGFREDLFHRLAVLTLRLPPLRERWQHQPRGGTARPDTQHAPVPPAEILAGGLARRDGTGRPGRPRAPRRRRRERSGDRQGAVGAPARRAPSCRARRGRRPEHARRRAGARAGGRKG